MIVLDASVLIAYLDDRDTHHADAWRLLEREIDDEFATNPLTLAETLVAPVRRDLLDKALAAIGDLGVRELPFPPDAASRLATIRARSGLKMPKCVVLLAAQDHHARLAAFDERLCAAAIRLGIEALPG